MQEGEFYQRIPGLAEPWFVSDVKLETKSQLVDVFVDHPEGCQSFCPEGGNARPVYDIPLRRLKHLGTLQFSSGLHATPPRVTCLEHHGVK
jgi:hypothetical protein